MQSDGKTVKVVAVGGDHADEPKPGDPERIAELLPMGRLDWAAGATFRPTDGVPS